jgi:hypothetical protein
MPGGSVYKDHTFNKETAHTSHENSTILRKYMNVSTSTLQNTAEIRIYRRTHKKSTQETKINSRNEDIISRY